MQADAYRYKVVYASDSGLLLVKKENFGAYICTCAHACVFLIVCARVGVWGVVEDKVTRKTGQISKGLKSA
jgi:hypothetical protein